MKEKEKMAKPQKKDKKLFRRVILISVIFSAWVLVAEHSSAVISNSPFTNLHLQYIISGILNFIANELKGVILAIGFVINGLTTTPSNLTYLAGPIDILGIIPLYSLVKRKTDSRGGALFVSLLFLFFALLIAPSWFSLLYLSLFPTLFMFGLALYVKKRKILSFIFMFLAMFVVPIASVAVFVFAINVFYHGWDSGRESFFRNSYSMVLEGASGFIFVVFMLKYSYMFFLNPFAVKSADMEYLSLYNTPLSNPVITYPFANVMPIVPEFSSIPSLELSGLVIAVIAGMFVLVRIISKKVSEGE